MDFSNLVTGRHFSEEKLTEYGFRKEQDHFIYQTLITDYFEAHFDITAINDTNSITPQLHVSIWDTASNELYLPFDVTIDKSPLAKALEDKVREHLVSIIHTCFSRNMKEQLVDFLEQKYGTQDEQSFPKYPEFISFKTAHSKKWYALFMNVSGDKLGIESDTQKDIVNIKLPPETVENLIDHQHYFPAYHMNKVHWISILLDDNTDKAQVQEQLNVSYELVEKHE